MPDTVRENIFENIQTTLAAIVAGGTYDNTIQRVERWKQHGQDFQGAMPLIVITSGPEKRSDRTYPLTICDLTVYLSLWTRQAESDSADSETVLNSILGDITKALKTDLTRGGYAVDTEITDIEPFDVVEGQPYSGLIITLAINYRHQQNNPKTVG